MVNVGIIKGDTGAKSDIGATGPVNLVSALNTSDTHKCRY